MLFVDCCFSVGELFCRCAATGLLDIRVGLVPSGGNLEQPLVHLRFVFEPFWDTNQSPQHRVGLSALVHCRVLDTLRQECARRLHREDCGVLGVFFCKGHQLCKEQVNGLNDVADVFIIEEKGRETVELRGRALDRCCDLLWSILRVLANRWT